MKLLLRGSSILLFIILFTVVLQAQFPANITFLWDPNVATENVTKYTIVYNGFTFTVLPVSCTMTECSQVLVVPAQGTYTISITATNIWGTSPISTLTFSASSPGRSGNLRIRVP